MYVIVASQSPWPALVAWATVGLAVVTTLLGIATWRMASATKMMLGKADNEVELAQEQVRIASEQVRISQTNQFASRQPILVPASPGPGADGVDLQAFLSPKTNTRITTRWTKNSSFWENVVESGEKFVCLCLRNVGPGLALLSTEWDQPVITAWLDGSFRVTGEPLIRAVAPGESVEIAFFGPPIRDVTSVPSGWPSGKQPAINLEIAYRDLTGEVIVKTLIWYECFENGFVKVLKIEYVSLSLPRESRHGLCGVLLTSSQR